jgi:uncharacterized membrane protein
VTLSPRVKALLLTAHVVASVGWLGSVLASLVLAVAAMTDADAETVRASYLALELVAWFALVPLALASLVTGVIQSLATPWGLFRHYWVVAKLAINLFATLVLLLYLPTLAELADDSTPASNPSPALHASAALLLLLLATALAVLKPRGLTPYGWRKQRERALGL